MISLVQLPADSGLASVGAKFQSAGVGAKGVVPWRGVVGNS